MKLENILHQLDALEEVTEHCFGLIQKKEFKALNDLLSQKDKIIASLHQSIQSFSEQEGKKIVDNEANSAFIALKEKIEKNIKDARKLAEDIDREKKVALEEMKKLKNGKKTLKALKEKINRKRVVSKII